MLSKRGFLILSATIVTSPALARKYTKHYHRRHKHHEQPKEITDVKLPIPDPRKTEPTFEKLWTDRIRPE